jgi:hypothetical protein
MDIVELQPIRISRVDIWDAVSGVENLCSRSTALSHSYEIYFRIASHKIRKLKTYLAFQGARRAREKDSIKIAKNTLTTTPALAVNRVN